ncbi:hypothetical protein CBR_g3448 [Chara braunii]|uniref:Integrase catalytic domain-containing protein n=1 Tax=Chara braunii TaxID=69332 RepID=A0A388JQX0_CHABU|nr:hypothetical protein CBR_g3448 [Chara braunii]|eukprot:GBG60204.1 hypothetical protein CBR_g3448 [Chara braunii]
MTAFLVRLGTYMQQVQEEQQREAAAEAARLNAIAHAEEQRRRQQADAAANHNKARRDAASVLMQQEAAHTATLQAWHVDPAETTEPTAEDQTKSALASMMHQVILTCNWQQVELARQARTITEYEETLKSLRAAHTARTITEYEETLNSLHARLDILEKDGVPHRHTASSSMDPPIRELEERLDNLVALVGNLNSFRHPATISQQIAALQADLRQLQQQPTGTCNNVMPKQFKMSKFSIDRFDDYHKADPISWWQVFTNELSIHLVPPESKISALYLCSTGPSQVWLNHLAQTEGVEVSKLHTKITWEAMTEKWRKRFIVDDAQRKGVNRIFNMHQGSQPTREWLTEWQKIVTIPNLDIAFVHLRREFFQRSVDALSTALGERSLYTDFDQIVEKARQVIQTNRWAANERRSQPTFVEKGKGPRPQQVATVQGNGQENDQAMTHESSEGDGQRRCPSTAKLEKLSLAGSEAIPLPTPPDTIALLTTSSTSREHAYVAILREDYEDYAVQLVPPLDQPQHVQESYACATSSPSPSEPASSPTSLGDSSVWSRLEELDPLTPEDFQWLPLPPSGSLPKSHCNALMAELRNYLHAAVPAPLMEDGVAVVDLREYIAKIDREYATQREDHPVNFYRRTVHVRDRNRVLVPCTVPPPHPSIGCHVVSTTSIRNSMARTDVEEMGICFLHALPPPNEPTAEQPPNPRIVQLLDSYGDVFEAPAGIVPNRPIRHEIILEDGAVPSRGCIYCMSEEELEVLRTQLDDLIDKGWIRTSNSPYGAPVPFVRKKNKELRLCIDYRKLNAQTIKNVGSLPWIDDLLERLGGAKYFSKLDLKSDYHQLKIHPRDRYKTASKTRYGHFEWVVMPFGLTNAPATFQAAITTEFRDMLDRFVLIYLDNILVYSRTLDEHIVHLRVVLDRLRTAKYKANRANCEFAHDHDTRFMSAFWTSFMKESDKEMKPSSARHPQTDGQTERAHQTAQVMLRTLIRTDQKDSVDRLPDIEIAYNTSVHPAIGVTPFELHHGGRKGRIFADLPFPRTADIDTACSPASVRKYRDLLAKARANMQKAQVLQQANRRRMPCPIRVGDLVWVSTEEFALEQDVSRKLLPKWFGPWPITSAAGDEPDGPSFVIEISPHLTVHPVFHASKLATYTPAKSDDFSGRRSQDPPSMDGHQEVDLVITHRKHDNKPM